MLDSMQYNPIVAATESGHTARMISKYRPHADIVAVTPHEYVARQLQLVWGVHPWLKSKDSIYNYGDEAFGNISWAWIYAIMLFIMVWTLVTIYMKRAKEFDKEADEIIRKYREGEDQSKERFFPSRSSSSICLPSLSAQAH